MRIAIVTGSMSRYGGGISVVVEALSRSLAELDHDVRVFTLKDDGWKEDAGRWSGARAVVLQRIGPVGFSYAPALTRRLVEFAPDIVHVHGIWTQLSRSVLNWSRRTGRPYLISLHGMLNPPALQRSPAKKRIARWLYEKRHLENAACLHALSQAEAGAIRAYGLEAPIAVIPNGTAPLAADPPQQQAPAWQSLTHENERVMLFLGRLDPIKNLPNFLEAWAIARRLPGKPRTRWALVIAGWNDEGYEQHLRSEVDRLGLSEQVHFVGALYGAAKDAALRAADAFVLPSSSEGLPIAVLEAWSYALPTLLTEACNLPQGYLVQAAIKLSPNAGEMAVDLGAFFDLPPSRLQAMGDAARRLALDSFSWKKIASDFAQAYRFTIDRGASAEGQGSESGLTDFVIED